MDELKKDAVNFIFMALNLGANLNDIIVVKNPTFKEISKLRDDIVKKIRENYKNGSDTHVHLHYGGHGRIKKGSTRMICNDDANNFEFPIEDVLRMIAQIPGAFVFSVLDCCRE